MPFKSFAQARKFKELVKEGKMKKDTAMEWWHETDFNKIPERVKKYAKKTRHRN